MISHHLTERLVDFLQSSGHRMEIIIIALIAVEVVIVSSIGCSKSHFS